MAVRSRSTTEVRPACWSPICTSGRAPSGSPASSSLITTSPGSGSATATTTAATPGSSRATRATEMGASPWVTARVLAIRDETYRTKTFRLKLPAPAAHLAGQHYVLRLTAPDGYTASRSYSIASPPDGSDEIELTVER